MRKQKDSCASSPDIIYTMSRLFFIISIFFLICKTFAQENADKFIYWEELSVQEKQSILSNTIDEFTKADAIIKINNKSDIDSVFNILDTIVQMLDDRNMIYYLHLLDTLSSVMEGIVAEHIGEYWIYFILKEPEYALNFIAEKYSDGMKYNRILTYCFDGVICLEYFHKINAFEQLKGTLQNQPVTGTDELKSFSMRLIADIEKLRNENSND